MHYFMSKKRFRQRFESVSTSGYKFSETDGLIGLWQMDQIYFVFLFCLFHFFALSNNIQWASKIVSYSSQQSEQFYAAKQVLGVPNSMDGYMDSPFSWATKTENNDEVEFIHVTFDDGYYNNTKILPLLEEYQIPAHIFVTTKNVLLNQRFWWDVLYEHMVLSGKNWKEIARKIEKCKRKFKNFPLWLRP